MAPPPLQPAELQEEPLPYIKDEQVGSGSYANVFKGHHEELKTVVAIKQIPRTRLRSPKLLNGVRQEAEFLKKYSHRHITAIVASLELKTSLYIIMEYCYGGDLANYKINRGRVEGLQYIPDMGLMPMFYPHPKEGGLAIFAVRSFVCQLTDAMKFLYAAQIAHRDLKPGNILLTLANHQDLLQGHPHGIPILKIADFGFAKLLPEENMTDTMCGSPIYMAPELHKTSNAGYTSKVDLWAMGCIIFELLFGQLPYHANNQAILTRLHAESDGSKLLSDAVEKHGEIPHDLRNLCEVLLIGEPVQRASHVQVFKHKAVSISKKATFVSDPEVRKKNVRLLRQVAEVSKAAYETLPPEMRPHIRPPGVEGGPDVYAPRPLERGSTDLTALGQDPLAAEIPTPIRPAPKGPPPGISGTPPEPLKRKTHSNRTKFNVQMISSEELEREFVMVEETNSIIMNKVADDLQQARDAEAKKSPELIDVKAGYKLWHAIDAGLDPPKPDEVRKRKNYVFNANQAASLAKQYPTGDKTVRSPLSSSPVTRISPPVTKNALRPTFSAPVPALSSSPAPSPPASRPTPARGSSLSHAITAASRLLARPKSVPSTPKRVSLFRGEGIPPEEKEILRILEDLSQKTLVLNEFANSRHDLAIVPPCTNKEHGHKLGEAYFPVDPSGRVFGRRPAWQCGMTEEQVMAVRRAAGEALQLYLAVMTFAQKALDTTLDFAHENEERAETYVPSGAYNGAVQWFRQVFNRARDRCLCMKEIAGDVEVDALNHVIHQKATEVCKEAALKETKRNGEPSTADLSIAEEEYETALLLLATICDDVVQEGNPFRANDLLVVEAFTSKIRKRLASVREKLVEKTRTPMTFPPPPPTLSSMAAEASARVLLV